MIYLILSSIIIGFLSNFVIYMYCKDDFSIKNLFSLNALKNKLSVSLVILLNIVSYVLVNYTFGLSIYAVFYCLIFSILICLSVIDVKIGIVPDTLNILIFIISILFIIITKQDIVYHILGFFLISVPFLLIAILTQGIGGGDIKLFAVTGLFLGSIHIFLAMFFCCFIASIVGVTLKYINKIKLINNRPSIPLVPFISIGVIISGLYGDKILNWYFSKFFY